MAATETGASVRHIDPGLRALVQTYVAYLSGCDPCARESARDAREVSGDSPRLHRLTGWRRAPFRTYSDRERGALLWAEAVVLSGGAGVGEGMRRQATGLFAEAELDELTRIVLAARGWRRLAGKACGPCSAA